MPAEYSETGDEGDFTYVPAQVDGDIKGYYLIAYGVGPSESNDLNENGEMDHVVLVLDGYSDGIELPDIKELL